MTTMRKRYDGLYTEVKRVVDGVVKQTTCACHGAGLSRKECATLSRNKTPCRCYCHSKKIQERRA